LAAGRAAQAERALRQLSGVEPGDPDPWRLRLQILRMEDRALEAVAVGWEALAAEPTAAHRELLRDLTLALLSDAPDDLARRTLASWIAADADDLDARVALFRRAAAAPRENDPTRAARIATLTELLGSHPDHAGLREALVLDLADAGETDRGRSILDAW